MSGGTRDDDRIEGRLLFPAMVSIGLAALDRVVALLFESLLGPTRERFDDLHRVNVGCQVSQHGGLVSGTGADFQDPGIGLQRRV